LIILLFYIITLIDNPKDLTKKEKKKKKKKKTKQNKKLLFIWGTGWQFARIVAFIGMWGKPQSISLIDFK
jgi:hypothetical protein